MDCFDNIRNLIIETNTQEALDTLHDHSINEAPQILNSIISLKSKFNRLNKKRLAGLSIDDDKFTQINYAILELVNSVDSTSDISQVSKNTKNLSRLQIISGNIDIIIKVNRKNLVRLFYFAGLLILIGLGLFVYSIFFARIIEGLQQSIMVVASIIASALSGPSIKDINQKSSLIEMCKAFKERIEKIINEYEVLSEVRSSEEIERINIYVNNILEKTTGT